MQMKLVLNIAVAMILAYMPAAARAQADQDKPELLTDDQINLIQVYEVHIDSDPPPKITISRDALREFLKDYQEDNRIPRGKTDQDAYLRADGYKQLSLIFDLRAREYYKHVQVRSPIDSLRNWSTQHRRYVHGFFQETFGSGAVPGVFLFPRDKDSARIEMTNFFILTQTQVDGKPMIDRNSPEDSLLLQWGLPREDAKYAAPEVEGWRPFFKGTDDPRFNELADWIRSLVRGNQETNYGIDYKIPKQEPAPQPAPQP